MAVTISLTVILCMLGFLGVIAYGGFDGVMINYTFGQFLVRFVAVLTAWICSLF